MGGGGTLYEEVIRLKAENRRLRSRADWYRHSRDNWRSEARAWRWGATHNRGILSTPSTDLSPTERAEASGVA